ncbi:1559_t:CDS:2 [Gigaspora rosea]|nr:1559_t:CDS:2 [Gigaspora rosea]
MTWQYPIERFNQIIYNQIFPTIPKIHDEHLAYSGENGQEFYFPSAQYKLSQAKWEQNMGSSERKMVIILGQSGFGRIKTEDSIGVKRFSQMGSYAYISASAIDHCDKEVDSDER